jgi:hypothetical protein
MRIASYSVACAGVVLAGSLAFAHPQHQQQPQKQAQPQPQPVTEPPSAARPAGRNLQVLPRDIERARLMEVMRDFSAALGVECSYCHTRDFASDENPHKNVTRGMMRMTARINGELMPAVAGLHRTADVTCQTCHRGSPHPGTEPPPPPPPTVPVPPAPPVPARPAPDVHIAPDTPARPH